MTSITVEATKPLGREAARRRALEELLRARPRSRWMYTRPTEPLARVDQEALREPHRGARREPRRVQGRLQLRRDRRAVRPPVRGQARARSPPGTYRNITGNVALVVRARRRRAAGEAADLLRVVPDHAGVRHPARALEAQELRREARCRPKTRSRRPASRSAPRSPGSLGDHRARAVPASTSSRRRIGLAISLELPLVIVDVQRGGPSTGLPTKTEQADLLLAMYGRHGEAPLPIVAAQSPSRLLRRRVRGGAHRAEVPHAGDPAHRRLPRQRRRAVAAPRRRRAARHLGAVRDRAEPRRRRSGRTCAIPRRSPARGRSRARRA